MRRIYHTFSHSEQKKFQEQNYKGCKKNYSAPIFSHVPSNFTLFYPKNRTKMKEIPPFWEYLLFSTQIYNIFPRNPNARQASYKSHFFRFFHTLQAQAQNSAKYHTELKVAVRTCEGKAMHRMTQNFVFDRRTQEHIAMRGGKWSHTESTECTEKSPRICAYLLVFF